MLNHFYYCHRILIECKFWVAEFVFKVFCANYGSCWNVTKVVNMVARWFFWWVWRTARKAVSM
jgi:hypothetical protein